MSLFQSFEWVFTGNLLSDFSCQNSRLHVSGGSESQGIFQHLVLVYSRAQKLMIIDSYEDSAGGNDIQIDYIK